MHIQRDDQVQALIKMAVDNGYRLERRTKSYFLYPPDKNQAPICLACTPSTKNMIRILTCQLKRSGLKIAA